MPGRLPLHPHPTPMPRLVRLMFLLPAVALSVSAHAQSVIPLAVAPDVALVYRLPNADALTVLGSVADPHPDARIPLSRRARATRGALIGGVVGAIIGQSVGALVEAVQGGSGSAVGLIGGALAGTGIGALLGHASAAPDAR